MKSAQKYKPKTTVLQDAGTNLNQLSSVYDQLDENDRAAVDKLCGELDKRLREMKGRTAGIGPTGLRELALALYIRVAYPSRTIDQCLFKATVG